MPSLPVALCLSGGGFRATLFHVGALLRLNEFGILRRISTFCSVSGGSITNGVLATRWPSLLKTERDGVFDGFHDLVAQPLIEFCKKDLRTEVLLWDRVNPLNWPELLQRDKSITDRLAHSYAENLDFNRPLSSLPVEPEFVFLATNMTNGGPWEFRQNRIGDWYTGFSEPDPHSLADAVAASSAFPPAFPPLRLTFNPARQFRGGHGNGNEIQSVKTVTLTDGGVYDNMGIEPVRKRNEILMVADAGHPLFHEELPDLGPYARLIRSFDIIWNQVGAQRKRWLIEAFQSKDMSLVGAYWGLASKVSNYGVADAPSYPNELLDVLERVRTDLDSFSEGEIGALVNHGYALANVAALKWTPTLLPSALPAFAWPFPEWVETDRVRQALRDSADKGILQDLWKSVIRHIGV